MKTFYVTRREVWTSTVRVVAENEEDATFKVDCGMGEEIDGSVEFSHELPIDTWTVEAEDDNLPSGD